jgi:hypothetical protein
VGILKETILIMEEDPRQKLRKKLKVKSNSNIIIDDAAKKLTLVNVVGEDSKQGVEKSE